jgi:transposase
MEAKKREHPVYTEQYKSQAVEMVIHSGKSVVQIARELGCSEASLHGWKKTYLKRQQPGQIDGQQQSPEQMAQTIRQLHKEVEYLKRQREILKKAMSIVGEEPNPDMR